MGLNRFAVWMGERHNNDGEAIANGVTFLCLIRML